MKKAEITTAFQLQHDFEQLFKPPGDLPALKNSQPDLDTFLKEFTASQQQAPVASSPAGEAVTDKRTEAATAVLIKAAVSGSVAPAELLPPAVSQDDQNFVLSLVKPDFSTSGTGEQLPWRLNQARRTEILQKMLREHSLAAALTDQLPPTDEFGILLRRVLGGNYFDINSLNKEELTILSSVLEALNALNIYKPDLAVVNGLLRRRNLFSDYHNLTGQFVGRVQEINTLLEFIKEPAAPSEWRGLLMTGMGGAGKSAIVAKLSEMLLNSDQAGIVIIDFDRPGVNPFNTVWLEEEFSRQLGDQTPEIAENQRQLRRSLRTYRQSDPYYNSNTFDEYSEHSRSSKEILYDLASDLFRCGAADKPLVIIFDTIEEIFQREQLSRLYRWLSRFSETFYQFRVKVIFSGRIYGTEFLRPRNIMHRDIDVSEFDDIIAEAFLKRQGLTTRTSRDIVRDRAFPMRPLELKLIAGLLTREKLTYKKLLRELAKNHNGHLTRDMFVGVVYRRVLLRIDDSVLRDFAYPGLIMRYINEDIVLKVLAPVLHPEITDIAGARAIVDKLARYSWLAHRDNNGDVWHSLELRRSMLNLVTAEVSEKAEAIRHRAVNYFNSRGRRKDAAEATYHKLFLYKLPANGEQFELEELRNAAGLLANSISELPKNAQLLLAFSRNEKVDAETLEALPKKFFILSYEETCRQLVEEGLLAQAIKIYNRAKKLGGIHYVPGRRPIKQWEKDLLFFTGYWRDLWNINDYWGRGSALANLLDYVIPAALVNIRQVDEMELEELLIEVINPDFDLALKAPGSTEILARLTFGLVLADYNHYMVMACQYTYPKMLTALKSSPDFLRYGREANMLSYLHNGKPLEKYPLPLAGLRLDRDWLLELRDLLPTVSHRLQVENIIKKLDSYPGIDSLLDFIDASRSLRSDWEGVEIDLKGQSNDRILSLTAGPNPIFRSPCRHALADAMKASRVYDQIGDVIRGLLPFKLMEASPDIFGKMIRRDTIEALGPLIEILDRSWLLGEFMHRVIPLFRKPTRLPEIAEAYDRWEKAYAKLITGFRRDKF